MNDPVSERLRSYYRSIQIDPPIRLEANVARAMDAAPRRPRLGLARPAFGVLAAGALMIVLALALQGAFPSSSPSASTVAGSSSTPIPTAVPTEPPTATPGVTAPPEQSASPSPEPSPTARPVGSLHDAAAMSPALSQPVAVRLGDGRVLITGGREKRPNGITVLRSQAAEIYESDPDRFAPTGSMADERAGHTATLLNDGRVLVVGGIDASDGFDNLATAELYDPATGSFTAAGSMAIARRDATATLLTNGLVLIAGGLNSDANGARASAELYDPTTGRFTTTGSMAAARFDFGAVGLEDGRVLVAGGMDSTLKPLTSAEIYDPGTGKFSPAGSVTAAGASMAVWLKDARVLFVSSGGLSLYDPAGGTFSSVAAPAASIDTATFTLGNVLLTEGGPAQVYQP